MSVLPPLPGERKHESSIKLYAANGTTIKTFGEKRLRLDLGLRRPFVWHFIIADVNQPILGVDFLTNFDLLVDMKRKSTT